MRIMWYCLLIVMWTVSNYAIPFKKVVIWGHKLHSHTHSYIHDGFFKAFQHLGYPAYWFDNDDDTQAFDFSSSLFITEGQVDQKIPLKDDCYYILHNCQKDKYQHLMDKQRCIILQVYTHDCLAQNVQKIDEYMFMEREGITIYLPWATDLLPHEIRAIQERMRYNPISKEPCAYFIGTIGEGIFGNRDKIAPFMAACAEQGIDFISRIHISPEEVVSCIQKSYLAPAIQGTWQCQKGYIPCRIFKNISYGSLGITNSETVWLLFNKKIVYNADTYQLFYDAYKRMKTIRQDELLELMDIVRDKHTYLNRIETLLGFFDIVIQRKS